MQAFAGEDAQPYLGLVEPAGRHGCEVKAHYGPLSFPACLEQTEAYINMLAIAVKR